MRLSACDDGLRRLAGVRVASWLRLRAKDMPGSMLLTQTISREIYKLDSRGGTQLAHPGPFSCSFGCADSDWVACISLLTDAYAECGSNAGARVVQTSLIRVIL